MHRISALVAAIVLVCLCVASAPAAGQAPGQTTPRLVRFTGVVAGVSGSADLTFAFYAEQASATPLWSETQHVVVDENGRYAVYLGASHSEGLPVELFASGEAKWLGVRVGGQAEQPRVLLVSVPYALKAADAETIGGKPLSAFVLAGSSTGTAADGLTYLNPQALTTPTKPLASGAGAPPQGGGTAGYLGVFTDSVNLGNSVIFQSGSSIGVGMTTPTAPFHVAGTSAPAAFFDVYTNALTALPVVYRAARGTPAAPAAVQTDDILGGLAVRGYAPAGFTGGQGQVMFKAAENWSNTGHGTYLQFTTTPLGATSFVERIRVTPGGNVGIGTVTPAQKLSVAGTVESTAGGFLFPDGTTQTTAARSSAGNNDAFGTGSLGNVTGGAYNAAFGDNALSADTTGSWNTASGNQALYANTTGNWNTASGYEALYANTTGASNTASGIFTLFSNTTGSQNTASGDSALASNTTGDQNTASGAYALHSNTIGSQNAATGFDALAANTRGNYNTASGVNALAANTTGTANTASGAYALAANSDASENTASGAYALATNTIGTWNTASGVHALEFNTVGVNNTASGAYALQSNDVGEQNVAGGYMALSQNSSGQRNVASGGRALGLNTHGSYNTANGDMALGNNTAGSHNIALGYLAGMQLTTGNYNIDIGHQGVAAESNTIRIGTPGTQTQTFIAGIRGVTTGLSDAVAVGIDSNGQLGTTNSSRRAKDDIADMAGASSGLMNLRPVTFHYKSDQNPAGRTLQYGLIAEEVAEIYPGLVAHSADGQIETVMYQFLPPMLLNEVQKQQRTIDALRAQVAAAAEQARARDEQMRTLTEQVAALTRAVAALTDRKQ